MSTELHRCNECSASLAGEKIYTDEDMTIPASNSSVGISIIDDGVVLSAWIQCPKCGEKYGGEVKLE